MKRDMDLVRSILLYVENQDINNKGYSSITIDGHASSEILGHVRLMEEHGLLKDCLYDLSGNTTVRTITWAGYDYLDKVRDDSIWKKTKETIVQKGLPLVFDTIKTISTAFLQPQQRGWQIPY